nr:hypothetical protein [Tanacetum cinerariifolium]
MKETNIILQGLPADIYSLVNNHRVTKDIWERVQLLMQDSSLAVPVFKQGDDLIDDINKMMSFLSTVVTSRFPSATVQDTNSFEQQDAMILSVSEQLSNQVTNYNKVNEDNLIANETLSAELERYKERILPMLYDGSVIAKETNVISIADSEETLMLEEESRSKILLKQSDPTVLGKKVNIKPINVGIKSHLNAVGIAAVHINASKVGKPVGTIRNKADLDTISMDDLYNNLKMYKIEVKGMSSSNSNTKNMAGLSSTNSSTNGVVNTAQAVNTANEVSTAPTQVNVAFSTKIDNLSDAVISAFLASQPNSPQLAHEDLE